LKIGAKIQARKLIGSAPGLAGRAAGRASVVGTWEADPEAPGRPVVAQAATTMDDQEEESRRGDPVHGEAAECHVRLPPSLA
jgi:hypothetical protein